MTNRIWIELEKPENDEHAHEQCRLANKLLKRLGLEVMEFWWGYGGKSITYNLTLNDSGMYLVCADRGHWFNLDKLAGECLPKAFLRTQQCDRCLSTVAQGYSVWPKHY